MSIVFFPHTWNVLITDRHFGKLLSYCFILVVCLPSLNLGVSLSKAQRKYYKDKHDSFLSQSAAVILHRIPFDIVILPTSEWKKGNHFKFSILIRFVFLGINTIHSRKSFALSVILQLCDVYVLFRNLNVWNHIVRNLQAQFYVQNWIFAAQLQSKWTTSGSGYQDWIPEWTKAFFPTLLSFTFKTNTVFHSTLRSFSLHFFVTICIDTVTFSLGYRKAKRCSHKLSWIIRFKSFSLIESGIYDGDFDKFNACGSWIRRITF